MKTATLGKEHSNKSILCSYTFKVLLLDGFCKFILHRFLIFGLYSFYTILFLFHSSCSFKSHTPANTEAHFHKPWLTWNRMLPAYQKPNGYLEAYIIVYIFISCCSNHFALLVPAVSLLHLLYLSQMKSKKEQRIQRILHRPLQIFDHLCSMSLGQTMNC